MRNSRPAPSPRILIFLTVFIDLLGFGIVIPILPALGADYLGDDVHGRGVALLMVAYSGLQMLFSPVWGRLSDRFGRRPIILVSLLGSTLSYVMFALARDYTWLLVSRAFAGLCGANITAAQAYIADITPARERTAGMGMIGAAFGLGFTFGPVLGLAGMIAWDHFLPGDPHLHVGAGIIAALICAVNFVWALFALPESLPAERRGVAATRKFATLRESCANLAHRVVGPLILLQFLVTFSFATVEVGFGIYAREVLKLDLRQIIGVFVFVGLAMAAVYGGLVRALVKRLPEATVLTAGIVLLIAGLVLLPLHASLLYLFLPMALLAVGQGLANPCILSLISRAVGGDVQGNVLGTNQAMSALARIAGPAFAGIVYDKVSPGGTFWGGAAMMSLCLLVALAARPRLLAITRDPAP